MYVPMFKGRPRVEFYVLKRMNYTFSDQIIPLVEILRDKQGNMDSLDYINNILEGKKVFIDFFRFSIDKYGSQIDIKRVDLSFKLNDDEKYYFEKLNEVSSFPSMIPVISIKKGFEMRKSLFKEMLLKLQQNNQSIAVRLTDDLYDDYEDIINNNLREMDYLLFDIENQNPDTKFIELETIGKDEYKYKKILLCATRNSKLNNGKYPEHDLTDLIYTNTKNNADIYHLDGFGDYCGLRDILPSKGRANRGAALALFYDAKLNKFYSYVNSDTILGSKGYKDLVPIILKDKAILDSDNTCPILIEIEEKYLLDKTGNWSTWLIYCMMRYIDQLYRYVFINETVK